MDKLRWIERINAYTNEGKIWNVLRVRLASWIAAIITVLLAVSLVLIPFMGWLEFYTLHIVLIIASLGVFFLLRNPFSQSAAMQQVPDDVVEVAPALAPAFVPVASYAVAPSLAFEPPTLVIEPLVAEPVVLAAEPVEHSPTQPMMSPTMLPNMALWPDLKEAEKDIPLVVIRMEAVVKEGEKDIATRARVTAHQVIPPTKVWEKELPMVPSQTVVVFKEAFKNIPYQERPVSRFKQWVKVIPQAEATIARSWEDLRRVGGTVGELVEQLTASAPLLAPATVRIPSERKQ